MEKGGPPRPPRNSKIGTGGAYRTSAGPAFGSPKKRWVRSPFRLPESVPRRIRHGASGPSAGADRRWLLALGHDENKEAASHGRWKPGKRGSKSFPSSAWRKDTPRGETELKFSEAWQGQMNERAEKPTSPGRPPAPRARAGSFTRPDPAIPRWVALQQSPTPFHQAL